MSLPAPPGLWPGGATRCKGTAPQREPRDLRPDTGSSAMTYLDHSRTKPPTPISENVFYGSNLRVRCLDRGCTALATTGHLPGTGPPGRRQGRSTAFLVYPRYGSSLTVSCFARGCSAAA